MKNFDEIKKEALESGKITERELENMTRMGNLAKNVAQKAFLPLVKDMTEKSHEIDHEESAALFACTMMPSIIMLAAYSALEVAKNSGGKEAHDQVLESLHECIKVAEIKVQQLEGESSLEAVDYDDLPDEVKKMLEEMGISKDDIEGSFKL